MREVTIRIEYNSNLQALSIVIDSHTAQKATALPVENEVAQTFSVLLGSLLKQGASGYAVGNDESKLKFDAMSDLAKKRGDTQRN